MDLQRIRDIAEKVAASLGLELVEVDLRGAGKSRMLRITIDRPGIAPDPASGGVAVSGVTHEDCANVSREVSTLLDVEQAVPGTAYTLEVSSPGLDRKLFRPADFERFAGSRIKVQTREPVRNNRHFEGRLEKFADGRITLDLTQPANRKARRASQETGPKIEIDFSNIEKANLVPEF